MDQRRGKRLRIQKVYGREIGGASVQTLRIWRLGKGHLRRPGRLSLVMHGLTREKKNGSLVEYVGGGCGF